jgi:transposase
VHHETLRVWVRQDEANDGTRADRLATVEREELAASVFFARELDQPRPR